MTERVGLERIYRYLGIAYNIILQFAYSEFTVHTQNLLCAYLYVGTEVWILHDMPVSAPKWTVMR